MNNDVHVTTGKNLSDAWAQVFLKAMELPTGTHLRHHLVLIPVCGQSNTLLLQDDEDEITRRLVDNQLRDLNKYECHTVANTIFPIFLWNKDCHRQQLYNRYLSLWDSGYLKQIRANRNGTYFQRLIAYQDREVGRKNQLEHIITTYENGNHRASALQASIMDPTLDHSNATRGGFPCLQHVHFTAHPESSELEVTGIYATQHILEKAYGNYLGLYRLGLFMAHEMGFRLSRIVCNTSLLKRSDESISKGQLRNLEQALLTRID